MSKIVQYRPAFFDGFEDKTESFQTVAELLAIDWVAKFASGPEFHRFSVSNSLLMAEYCEGRRWRVVGSLSDGAEVDLPKWSHYKSGEEKP